MPDDPISAALAPVREHVEAFANPANGDLERAWRLHGLAKAAPRLLAAVDAVLKHHHPRQLYDRVENYRHEITCGHDGNYDGDRHYEGDDGLWYCLDRPSVKVCASCSDPDVADVWAAWPCATYTGMLAALTGEGKTDGE